MGHHMIMGAHTFTHSSHLGQFSVANLTTNTFWKVGGNRHRHMENSTQTVT